ncbi:tRNA-dihydrouridine(20) synthase [NAD(P)+]-like [Nowakowskiella sp. JEL0407]|nr:tRNA-dihydrouridine(20) synthase [NAD(P)+]-like [Nowakowskiella sp. JEL0407]
MVRVGTLPMRLLALRYGADLVYSPEIIDRRLICCKRVENEKLGTVDYVAGSDGTLCLRIHPIEKDNLIVQIGTSDPELAVKAAKLVEKDVAGIDVNCGCPKRFSIQGGMGAALLSEPDKLCKILKALVENLSIPVTCKIRIFKSTEETTDLLKKLSATGVKAIAIHCRTRYESPTDPGHWEAFAPAVQAVPKDFPIIANGDLFSPQSLSEFITSTGVTSLMFARGAQWNPSIFLAARGYLHSALPEQFPPFDPESHISKNICLTFKLSTVEPYTPLPQHVTNGMQPIIKMMQEYVKISYFTDMPYQNAKFTLMQMFPPVGYNRKKRVNTEGWKESEEGSWKRESDDLAQEIEFVEEKTEDNVETGKKRRRRAEPDIIDGLDKKKAQALNSAKSFKEIW